MSGDLSKCYHVYSRALDEYNGMSYEDAFREGDRLVQQFGWYQSIDRLCALRFIMASHMRGVGSGDTQGVGPAPTALPGGQ